MIGIAVLTAAATISAGTPTLIVSPGRVVLDGAAEAEVHITALRGTELIDVAVAPYALDVRGRPRLRGATGAPHWCSVRPAWLRAGAKGATVKIAAAPPRTATPGDRPFALVLTTRPARGKGVGVRLRIAVLVIAHVHGTVVRRLVVGPVVIRSGRLVQLTLRNSGNAVERLARGRLVLTLLRRGRVVVRLHPPSRLLLPHSRAVVVSRLPRSLHGPATVHVSLGSFVHRYPLRL